MQLLDEFDVFFNFRRGGIASRRQPDRTSDLGRQVARMFALQSLGKCRRLLLAEIAVEQIERLCRHGRDVADGTARIGIRLVVVRQQRHLKRALHKNVNAATSRLLWARLSPAIAGSRLTRQHFLWNLGKTLSPPALTFSCPLRKSIESRISSAVSRRIGNRHKNSFDG